jgi:hypothetical protein
MNPQYRAWTRGMPNLGITEAEALALVPYLKWMAAVDTNGFPANFNQIEQRPSLVLRVIHMIRQRATGQCWHQQPRHTGEGRAHD